MNKGLKINSCAIILMAAFALSGCKKSNDYVPNVYVDIYLYTTDPAFSPLNAVPGYTYLSGGSKGIIVYRKSQTEFMAYDRHCTYKVSEGNVVAVEVSGLIAKDAVCGSKFILTDGSVLSGSSASNPLKRYQISFDGTVLHIFN
ncbi:MAG: hypothetical protein HY840_07745 [Bacteroidetes bacterium]|nr:hypothetical protein [Bacteroidota bacterium]